MFDVWANWDWKLNLDLGKAMVESSRAGTEWTLSRMNFQSPLLSQHVREVQRVFKRNLNLNSNNLMTTGHLHLLKIIRYNRKLQSSCWVDLRWDCFAHVHLLSHGHTIFYLDYFAISNLFVRKDLLKSYSLIVYPEKFYIILLFLFDIK